MTISDAQQSPVINLVNKILVKALQEGGSEIHIEPQKEFLQVRFRKDGVLCQAFDALPMNITGAVVSRLKTIADLDINQRHLPQNGRFRKTFRDRQVDFLVSILPSRYGEKAVLRILDNSATPIDLDKLIAHGPTLEIFRKMVSRPSGLILVTGPVGSGKSTTLYSVLAELNKPGVNISTVENLIKYYLPGITQVELNQEKVMDYGLTLQSFLLQGVDVILVGETQYRKTANMVIEAALKGSLVLTTLYANDAASAIARLNKMSVEPLMVSDALIGVLSQRLIRRVCPQCRIAYHPSQAELARFGLSAANKGKVTFYKAKTLTTDEINETRYKGNLCPQCNGMGYKGQVGVYEVLFLTKRLKTLIAENADAETIKNVALEEGMKTLLSYALELAFQGQTTLEEIERVLPNDIGSAQSYPYAAVTTPSAKLSHRFQQFERQLEALTRELQQLKQGLETDRVTITSDLQLDEELSDPGEFQQLKQELETDRVTIPSDLQLDEELSDPGEFQQLKQELEADKVTTSSDPQLDEELPDPGEFQQVKQKLETDELTTASDTLQDEELPDPW